MERITVTIDITNQAVLDLILNKVRFGKKISKEEAVIELLEEWAYHYCD